MLHGRQAGSHQLQSATQAVRESSCVHMCTFCRNSERGVEEERKKKKLSQPSCASYSSYMLQEQPLAAATSRRLELCAHLVIIGVGTLKGSR